MIMLKIAPEKATEAALRLFSKATAPRGNTGWEMR